MSNPASVATLCEAITGEKHTYGQHICPHCGHEHGAIYPARLEKIGCHKCGKDIPTRWRKKT